MCCRVTKILHPKHSRIPTILTYKYPSEYIQRNCENIVEKSEMERNEIHTYIYIKREESRSTRLYSRVTLLFNLLAPCHRSSLSLFLSRIFARI